MQIYDLLHELLFFTILDLLALILFSAGIYSFYNGLILNGVLTLILGVLILTYFLTRRKLRNKNKIANFESIEIIAPYLNSNKNTKIKIMLELL